MSNWSKIERMHTCSVNGCTWASERRLFTCMPHWLKVPQDLQSKVWDAYRALPQKRPDRETLLNDPAYCQAAAAVIEHLAAAEGRAPVSEWRTAATGHEHGATTA